MTQSSGKPEARDAGAETPANGASGAESSGSPEPVRVLEYSNSRGAWSLIGQRRLLMLGRRLIFAVGVFLLVLGLGPLFVREIVQPVPAFGAALIALVIRAPFLSRASFRIGPWRTKVQGQADREVSHSLSRWIRTKKNDPRG